MQLPQEVRGYVLEQTLQSRAPAYLCTDDRGNVVDWGGEMGHYGQFQLRAGTSAEKEIPFLTGLIPTTDLELSLPKLEVKDGVYADIHLFRDNGYNWVLLLDVTSEVQRRTILYQKANELKLLRATLSQKRQKNFLQKPSGLLDVSVLTLNLADEVPFHGLQISSQTESRRRDDLVIGILAGILEAIRDEGGVVTALGTRQVQAAFGSWLMPNESGKNALAAGFRILDELQEWGEKFRNPFQFKISPRIGIATGPTQVAWARNTVGLAMMLSGTCPDSSEELAEEAAAWQLWSDQASLHEDDPLRRRFQEDWNRVAGEVCFWLDVQS